MIVRLDSNSKVPGYQQIADQIRIFLVNGALPPGRKLPTVRELAMDLGVHFNTVAAAYRTLAEEGWISLERRRGATVLDRASPPTLTAEAGQLEIERLHQTIATLRASGLGAPRLAAELKSILGELEKLPCKG